jgi:hypothetical protein
VGGTGTKMDQHTDRVGGVWVVAGGERRVAVAGEGVCGCYRPQAWGGWWCRQEAKEEPRSRLPCSGRRRALDTPLELELE